jgi:hypothetical protein
MRIYQQAYIKCSKDTVVTILNRAFRALGSRNRLFIEADDCIEAINHTIGMARGMCFTLLDFLDDKNRMDSPYKDVVQTFIDNLDIDNPYPDETNYHVSIADLKELDSEYTLKVFLSTDDDYVNSYRDEDWQDWCERMVRLYGCRIVYHEEGNPAEGFWHSSCFYDPDGGEVKKTGVELAIDTTQYWELMDRLKEDIGMDLEAKLEFAKDDYENLALVLRDQIAALEQELNRVRKAKSGIQEDEPSKEINDEDLPF